MPTSGPDLRAERRAANVTVTALATRMSRSRQTVHVLERSAVITIEQADQYRVALHDAIVASEANVA